MSLISCCIRDAPDNYLGYSITFYYFFKKANNCYVYKMSGNKDNCPSEVPIDQGDILKFIKIKQKKPALFILDWSNNALKH